MPFKPLDIVLLVIDFVFLFFVRLDFPICSSLILSRYYSASHKVEISERFKSHRYEFKGQSSNLKHVEKN